ncbi:DUF4358 domain-containing protein [Paenibacillus luteus]|uniref:DUF4358 domain-containing protein n=1 Tax=Paenibacillus luteus TaxID=2545753 RepID=UPI001143022E|nr:DUF4358 domain-containing protein [Paenibacillus luteus]
MFMSINKYISFALLAIALTVIAAGCSNGKSEVAAGGNPSSATNSVSPTDAPVESAATDEPEISEEPAVTAEPLATEAPAATVKPDETTAPAEKPDQAGEATAKPSKKPKPTPTIKPTATAKPTKPPVIVLPSSKPTATAKPTSKPTATPQPSILPLATPSPSPKPTTKPDSENPSNEVTVADIAAKLASDAGLGPLQTVEGEQVKDIYGIDEEALLVDGIFKQPQMMIQAGEFSIVQMKSDKNFADVEAGFKKRAEAVQKAFESYLQDQYEQAQNYQIIRNGDFVLFSITPDQKKTAEIFNSFFKK